MQEHTKKPWFYEPGYSYRDPSLDKTQWGAYGICDANDAIAVTTHLENDEANARRIVACVNACEGVPTEQLEWDNSMFLDMMKERNTLEQQRDELLAALKDMDRAYMNLLENGRERILFLGGDCDELPVMEAGDPYLRQARAAIAKVKP